MGERRSKTLHDSPKQEKMRRRRALNDSCELFKENRKNEVAHELLNNEVEINEVDFSAIIISSNSSGCSSSEQEEHPVPFYSTRRKAGNGKDDGTDRKMNLPSTSCPNSCAAFTTEVNHYYWHHPFCRDGSPLPTAPSHRSYYDCGGGRPEGDTQLSNHKECCCSCVDNYRQDHENEELKESVCSIRSNVAIRIDNGDSHDLKESATPLTEAINVNFEDRFRENGGNQKIMCYRWIKNFFRPIFVNFVVLPYTISVTLFKLHATNPRPPGFDVKGKSMTSSENLMGAQYHSTTLRHSSHSFSCSPKKCVGSETMLSSTSSFCESLPIPQISQSTERKRSRASPQTTHKSVTFLLNLLLLFLCLHLSHRDQLLTSAEANSIPLGVVVEQGSAEVRTAFAYSLSNFTPLNITSDRGDSKFAFNAYVDTINTADAFKLSKLICNQFFRGVYVIVGSMNSESFQTFHSYANTFQMPIVTPNFPTRPLKVSKYQIQQSLSLNSAMDFVTRGENATLSPLVRSPLINDTFQKLLDNVTETSSSSSSPSSTEQGENRDTLLAKLVEEIVERESRRMDFVTKIQPDLHQAILDITTHYGWRNVIYLFHSNEGLLRLQSIFERQGFRNDSIRVRVMKQISSTMDALSIIRNIEVAQRFQPKHIILDCPASLAKEIIISHARDLHLGRRTYHYLIAGLTFDEPWERNVAEFTAVNITGFRMVDPSRKLVKQFLETWKTLDTTQFEGAGKRYISATAALMYDGVSVIKEAFTSILRENPGALQRERGRNLTCNSGVDFLNPIVPFEHGKLINERLRQVQTEGLTGHIQFNEQGSRTNFTIDVMEITLESGQTKIGEWSDVSGFVTAQQLSDPLSKRKKPDMKKEYIVTSILEEPYLMLKKAEKGENLTGNDQYEGFCKDLADLIAKHMNIKYKIVLVKDKKYGAENPQAPGGWDGMIGELIRHEADLAVSSLTITSQRETVVDFSMDFMEAGISIMIKKPQTEMPGAFSFVKPMKGSIWFASFAALVVVASVLLVVQGKPSRQYASSTSTSRGNNNAATASDSSSHTTFPNTLWFSIASVFRQSTPFTPRYGMAYFDGDVFKGARRTFLRLFSEAHVAISAVTITAERERVVDFTKPFLNLGISIMFYKPKKANSGVFGFMSPLSTNTWYCVIVAYIGVSFVLYIVSRFNATEWITETEGTLHNQFSFGNALWFSLGALLQQSSDLIPRSFAGRLVGSVWWFFTLILISSYTANFAAVRTVNRMVLPIKSAKDLSEQSEIQYGTLLGGSTYEFFRRSEVPVYKRMFEFMSGPNQLNVKSYDDGIKLVREKKGKYALLIESPKNDYTNQRKPCDTMKVGPNLDSKGFGIGTPLGSPLKHQINLEVLRLKENGILSKLESKWWFERSECDVTNKQETATGDEELSLGSLAGIFYILIIGLVLSMVVSFLEFCYNSKKEAQRCKVSLTEAMKRKAKNTITGPLPSNGNEPVTCIH